MLFCQGWFFKKIFYWKIMSTKPDSALSPAQTSNTCQLGFLGICILADRLLPEEGREDEDGLAKIRLSPF